MAKVSSHLRNFAVAEVIGFVARLDSHPKINSKPVAEVIPAAYQQTQGTKANPLTHAIPSGMLLDGSSLVNLYTTAKAQDAVRRVFGMGVMAPENWDNQTFPYEPRQNNIADTITERHHWGGGLVDAFEASGKQAVKKGVWDGSGRRRHSLDSLVHFIGEIYGDVWVPQARDAYSKARSHLKGQLATDLSVERRTIIEQRREIVEIQSEILETETRISTEAAANVWQFTLDESW